MLGDATSKPAVKTEQSLETRIQECPITRGKREGTKTPGYSRLKQSLSSPHPKTSYLPFCLERRPRRHPQQLTTGSKDVFHPSAPHLTPSLSDGLHQSLRVLAEMILKPLASLAGPGKADPYS